MILEGDVAKAPLLKRKLFNRRMNRANFLIGMVLLAIFLWLLGTLIANSPFYSAQNDTNIFKTLLFVPLGIIGSPFLLSLATRRSHDFYVDDKIDWRKFGSGSLVFTIDLFVKPSVIEPNKYGSPQSGIGIRQIIGMK
ncbi:MAG TPA: hypothetical protein VNA13_04145 [Xanthomonadales bacterium]|nr:hypothetical protein [Xanthomonadales bacterium]